MKKIIIFIVVVLVLGGGWYLASPLFIEDEVNEAFPPLDALPTEGQMLAMSDQERAARKDEIMDMAAKAPDTVMSESMDAMGDPSTSSGSSSEPIVLAAGEFMGADNFHQGSGSATVYELPTGKRFLRFENFSVTNGPDLRILLTEHPNPSSQSDVKSGEYIELAKLKGNKGDQNYEIPLDIDIDDFQNVLIYCKPFHVVFANAVLQ